MTTSRKKVDEKPELRLRMSVDEARNRLEERTNQGIAIKSKHIQSDQQLEEAKKEYYKWNDYNTELLRRMFTNTDMADEYSGFFGFAGGVRRSMTEQVAELKEDIESK